MNKNPIDMLLDENNCEPIVLYNENNEECTFEQIAVIPIDEVVYVILKPVGEFNGIGEDEALVFAIVEEDGENILEVVVEDEIIDAVFGKFNEMLEDMDDQ